MRRLACLLAALAAASACATTPRSARAILGEAAPSPPAGSARSAIVLDLEDRGAGPGPTAKVRDVVIAALENAGVDVRREEEIEAFRDADRRHSLVGKGDAGSLGRIARRFGADLVVAGWAGRTKGTWAASVRAVDRRGRVVSRAAAVWRGEAQAFYVAERQAAERLVTETGEQRPTSPAAVRVLVRHRSGFFDRCLADATLIDPALSGEADVVLTVNPDGSVSGASVEGSTFANQDLVDCLRGAADALVLPGGPRSPVTVHHHVALPAGPAATP